jgi:hypothetical protein
MKRAIGFVVGLVAVCAGCGGDAAKMEGPGTGPLYVISAGVATEDDFIGYLATVKSVDETSTFTLDAAKEIEASWIFSKEGQPYVYAASLFSPTITRFVVKDDGTLDQDKTVSFADYGVQVAYMAALAPIYSDEKSYFVDDAQDQLVIWNPKEMKAIGTIPFGDMPEGALPPAPEGSVFVHDGLIMTAIDWSDWMEDSSAYGSHVRLIAIDPATDKVVSVKDDDRITYAGLQGTGSDGAVYYSPASLISAYTLIGAGHGSPSRALRVPKGSRAFDPTFTLDLSALVGGRPAGDFTWIDGSTALIRAWHAELADPVTPATWQDVLWAQAGFKWWRWHAGDAQAVEIPGQQPGTLGASVIKVDGKLYVVRTNEDSKTSTLDRIEADGAFHPTLTGPGQFIGSGVLRIR